MTTTHPLSKPRVRPTGPNSYDVDFGSGKKASIFKSSFGQQDWIYETPDLPQRPAYSQEAALAAAWMGCIEAPEPVAMTPEEIAPLISEAEGNATTCAKLMRRLLKLRTGIAWSVTGGRGTARSWLNIHVPKARRVGSDGQPTGKSWGYMGARDRALLGVILGELPHYQGESIRTEAGVREWYLWRLSGHAAPAGLKVAEPGWD